MKQLIFLLLWTIPLTITGVDTRTDYSPFRYSGVDLKRHDVNEYKLLPNLEMSDFDSRDELGSFIRMDKVFLDKLDYAQSLCPIPFVITSGYRTHSHNHKVGGVTNSAHTRGLAADIQAIGATQRRLILEALKAAGFSRFGISKDRHFIHVDLDDKINNVWNYD